MGGFGFAPPIQHRLPMATGPSDTAPATPALDPRSLATTQDIGNTVHSAHQILQKLGIGGAPPAPSAGPVSTPMIPSDPSLAGSVSDVSSAIAPSSGAALNGIGDAAADTAASAGPDIASFIASLFL